MSIKFLLFCISGACILVVGIVLTSELYDASLDNHEFWKFVLCGVLTLLLSCVLFFFSYKAWNEVTPDELKHGLCGTVSVRDNFGGVAEEYRAADISVLDGSVEFEDKDGKHIIVSATVVIDEET